jgi:hypothetical protein
MRLTIALLSVALLGAGAALAQDPRATAAQQAARAFLALTDRDDGKASWQAAGKQFQNAITDARWAEALHGARAPLGALVERTLLTTQFMSTFPGAKASGDYVTLIYRTSFAQRTDASETVTLERETDGAWRVIGYFIR